MTHAHAVELLLCPAFVLLGLSHIVQPAMWRDYFVDLHGQGPRGIVTRSFTLELWPALLILCFHQVWSGPAVLLTLYGHALCTKVLLSLLAPSIGLRSLAMADKGDTGFRVAGVVLVGMGALCALLVAGVL